MLPGLTLAAWLTAPVDPPAIALEWPTVAGCPTQTEVVDAATRLIAGGQPRPVRATAALTRAGATWTLALAVEAGGTQHRELASPDCAALAQATAVILAVAAEPLQVATRIDAAPPAQAVAPAIVEDPLELEVAPGLRRASPPPQPRGRAQLGLFVHGGAGLGPTKRMTPGLAAGLAVVWPRVRLELRATYWGPAALRLARLATVGADVRLATGGLRGCPLLVRGAVTLQLCAGLEVGATIASAVGLTTDYAPRALWAAASLAPGLRWRPRRWLGLGLEIEGVMPFTRKQFEIESVDDTLGRTAPVGLRLLAGVEFNFP